MQVLQYVIDIFKAERYNQNKTLFLFGSYTIGKERLFLEAAKLLQQKVRPCVKKHTKCLSFLHLYTPWPNAYHSALLCC